MGSVLNLKRHQQVCCSATAHQRQIVPVSDATYEEKLSDEAAYSEIDQSNPQPGVGAGDQDISIYPMLSERTFLRQLRDFHEALVTAIVNIVDRWWDDESLPARMPLEPRAEEILKWINAQSKSGAMPAFADCLGNWRPDFLLNRNDILDSAPTFQICEINCRAPFNAVIHSAYKHRLMKELLRPCPLLQPAGDSETMIDSLLDHFDLSLPIHIVRGRDTLGRQEFIQLFELRTGLKPRLVDVRDLQSKADVSSSTGFALYCRDETSNVTERVYQVALALFPEEYSLLPLDMLRHLARISINDFRVSLLVNDQRFLGIILQELDLLSKEHQVLTSDQVKMLREGIVDTILPGSPQLQKILESSIKSGASLKDNFILKAARASRGDGHLMGDELSDHAWETILMGMQDPTIRADTTTYVLQPYVRQPKFDILVHKTRVVENSLVVGTYYAANGRFVGLGPWRTGSGKICNVYRGGCVLVNSITTADTQEMH